MKEAVFKKVAIALLAIFVFAMLPAWGAERKASVTSQPLDCYSQGNKTVCFDGQPTTHMVCEFLEDNTVLCTAMH